MNVFSISVAPTNAAANNICASQSPGAGAILLNGTLATNYAQPPVITGGPTTYASVAIASTGNDTGKTATVVGTGTDGRALTEVIPLTNASTAFGTSLFGLVTSITLSAAFATAGSAYWVYNGVAQWGVTSIRTSSAGSGTLVLNGSTKIDAAICGAAQTVRITSGGNDSGINFTFTGLDADGNAQTETMSGPNATFKDTTYYYKVLFSITHTGSVATTFTAGCNANSVSPSFQWTKQALPAKFSVGLAVTGTITYELQECFTDTKSGQANGTWIQNPNCNGKTAAFSYNYGDFVPLASRIYVSASTSGTVTGNFVGMRTAY